MVIEGFIGKPPLEGTQVVELPTFKDPKPVELPTFKNPKPVIEERLHPRTKKPRQKLKITLWREKSKFPFEMRILKFFPTPTHPRKN